MNDLNRATIMGNLTRDPELRQTPNGRSVCSFGVATNRRWNNQSGEPQEQVEFHDVVAWGNLAEICDKILYKGRKAYIEGRLQTRTWEGQDGVKRTKTEIVADNVIAVGAPRQGGGSSPSQGVDAEPAEDFDQRPASEKKTEKKPTAAPTKSKKPQTKKETTTTSEDEEEINLDDIPF